MIQSHRPRTWPSDSVHRRVLLHFLTLRRLGNRVLVLVVFDLRLLRSAVGLGLLRLLRVDVRVLGGKSCRSWSLPLVGRIQEGTELIHGSTGDAGFSYGLEASSLGRSTCEKRNKQRKQESARGKGGKPDELAPCSGGVDCLV